MPGKGKRPDNIPSSPHTFYKDNGWISWPDWLDTGKRRRSLFLPFDEARKFVRSRGLKNQNAWAKHYRKIKIPAPENELLKISSNPQTKYKEEWLDWVDWLGSEDKIFLPFEEAREFVRSLNLTGSDWWKYSRGELPDKGQKPENIPTRPDRQYKDQGWIDWRDRLNEKKKIKSKY